MENANLFRESGAEKYKGIVRRGASSGSPGGLMRCASDRTIWRLIAGVRRSPLVPQNEAGWGQATFLRWTRAGEGAGLPSGC